MFKYLNLIVIVICASPLMLSGCAHSQPKTKWHLELEIKEPGKDKWIEVYQDNDVQIIAGPFVSTSKCRHHVLLQYHILSELGVKEFKYIAAVKRDGEVCEVARFDDYIQAYSFTKQLTVEQGVIYGKCWEWERLKKSNKGKQ